MPNFVAFECDLDVPPNAWRLSLCCNDVSTEEGHHRPNRPCCHRRHIKTIITSSHGHEEHAAFYFEALPQLHYMEQMMTQTGSQWLTAVTSSPITGHVSEIELQNENQRAQYKQEKM